MLSQSTNSNKPLALITGASTGIGYELAIQFAKAGYDLVIVSQSDAIREAKDALRGMGCEVSIIQTDLAQRSGVDQVVSEISEYGRPLSALVLNAGVGSAGEFIGSTDLDSDLNMINLNVVAVVSLAKLLIPKMVEDRSGRVLITSSIASLAPGPFNAVYHATKAFVQSFTEAIREELKDSGVTVTALMPGATETPFFARAHMLGTKVGQAKKDDPATVALQGFEAMMRGDDHVIGGSLMNKVQGLTSKIASDPVKAKQSRVQNEPISYGDDDAVDAVDMLTDQHREAEDLFDRIGRASGGERRAIFRTLAAKLLDHMRIEEDVFYPAVQKVDQMEVAHSREEHLEAKSVISKIKAYDGTEGDFFALVNQLKERIDNHVQDEENTLFPRCRESLSKDHLIDLADEMRDLLVEKESLRDYPGAMKLAGRPLRNSTDELPYSEIL